jgi:hypothetical protein
MKRALRDPLTGSHDPPKMSGKSFSFVSSLSVEEVSRLSAKAARLAGLYRRYFARKGVSESIVGRTETLKIAWQLERLLNPKANRFGNPDRCRWGRPATVVDALTRLRDALDCVYRAHGWQKLCELAGDDSWKEVDPTQFVGDKAVVQALAGSLDRAAANLREVAADAYQMTKDEFVNLEKSLAKPPTKESAKDDRDRWIYYLMMSGVTYKSIIAALKRQPTSWRRISTIPGIREAANSYARRNELSLPGNRQRGRPRRKK